MGKIAILNTKIIDGTKEKAYRGHVIINGEIIEKVVSVDKPDAIKNEEFDQIINGKAYVLTPGFIDTHSHSDLQVLEKEVLEPKIRQGITTEILGQDGIAMAPLPIKYISDWQKNIAGLDGDSDTVDWEYETVEGYFKAIETFGPSSNMTYLVPHGNVRMAVMGLEDTQPTKEMLKEMQVIVRDAMERGCVGLSSGLIYIPCAYSYEEEIIEMCKVVAEYGGVFVVHQRSEANQILESMDEIIRIGVASGVKIHFSHFKICGKNNWHLLEQVMGKIDEAKEKGLEVSFDLYPYTAGSTMLSAILPPWMHIGGTNKMLERLKDSKNRQKLMVELNEEKSKWDNFIEFAGVSGIYITSVKTEKNQEIVGKSLVELGKMKGKEPLEAAFDLLIEEENNVGMIDFYGNDEHLKTFVAREEMNLCTDGLLGGKPHPRAYGSFPRLIAEYVKKEGILTLEEAIYKMTYRPAKLFGLKRRGRIKEGNYADLILFDENDFRDLGTYVNPMQFPTGLQMVMVNGHILYDIGKYDIKPCGKLLLMNR